MAEKIQMLRAVWATQGWHKQGQQKAVANQLCGEGKVVCGDQPGKRDPGLWGKDVDSYCLTSDIEVKCLSRGPPREWFGDWQSYQLHQQPKSFSEDNEVQVEFGLC